MFSIIRRTKINNFVRKFSNQPPKKSRVNEANLKSAYLLAGLGIFILGVSYASVPLYKIFCQVSGYGGTTQVADEQKAREIRPVKDSKLLTVYFTSNTHDTLPWTFKPIQNNIRVQPGETALAFYNVKNNSKNNITGVATYNVYPPKAGIYFNKIQCFCFEEQRLQGNEELEMPVFFFIDPEILDDPAMKTVNHITLSYTFFKTDEEINDEEKNSKKTLKEKEIPEEKK